MTIVLIRALIRIVTILVKVAMQAQQVATECSSGLTSYVHCQAMVLVGILVNSAGNSKTLKSGAAGCANAHFRPVCET